MGSFNETCMISDLTITNNKEVIVLLLKKKKKFGNTDSRKNTIYDINECYECISLPIKGKYNEYGKIVDIVKDKNVLILEDYYGLKIEDILDFILESYSTYYNAGTFCNKFITVKEKHYSVDIDIFESFLKEKLFSDYTKENNQILIKKNNIDIVIDFDENKILNKTNNKTDVFNDEELFRILHMKYDLFLYYEGTVELFVKEMTLENITGVMILNDVYEKLVELSQTDIQWYEDYRFNFNKYREILIKNYNKYQENLNLMNDLKNDLIVNKSIYDTKILEEKNELLNDLMFENKMILSSSFVKNFFSHENDFWQRRFEYNKMFNNFYNKKIITDNDFYDVFKDFLSFEIVMDSLGKYYRLPGKTPQFKSDREYAYIQFLNELVVEDKIQEEEE